MKTEFLTKEQALKNRKWVLIDADDKIVGRLASKISTILRGKNKPDYTPHNDCGDFVVVINAEKIKFSGNKLEDKIYYRHTNFIGGIKKDTPADLLEKRPELILLRAVKNMMPKGNLGLQQLKKLKVYCGTDHPHQAQKLGVS